MLLPKRALIVAATSRESIIANVMGYLQQVYVVDIVHYTLARGVLNFLSLKSG